MDFFVILVMVVFLKGGDDNIRWTSRPYGADMQTCMEELGAIKAEQMSHPEVKSIVAYCVPFAPMREATR